MRDTSKTQFWFRQAILALAALTIAACDRPGMDDQKMVQMAKGYLAESKLREASLELSNALQENPDNAEARYLMGQINLDVGDVAGAEKEYRRAGKAGWKEEEVQIGLARALINGNAFQSVIDDIEIKETYSAPARANLYALRAAAQAGLGDLDQARATLASGVEIDAGAFQVLKTTVQIQLASGNFKGATSSMKQALSAYPDNPELRLLSAITALQSQDKAGAMEAYQAIIEQFNGKYITVYDRLACLGLARLQILDKNLDLAQDTLAPLFKEYSNDPETNFLGGMLAFEQANLDLAEERLLKVLKDAPDHAQTLLLFGTVNYAQKDYEQAAYYIAKYVSAVPDNLGARKLLGRTYMLLGEQDQARATLQPALKESADDAELLALIGLSRLQGGQTASGIEGLEQAVKAAPDSAAIRGELAKAYISAGDTDRAIQQLNTLLAQGGNEQQTQTLLVLAHLRAGNVDKAINTVLGMLARFPEDPAVLTLVGNVFAASGDRPEARKYFNKTLKYKPGFVPATMSLARLDEIEGNSAEATTLYRDIADSDTQSIAPLLALARLAEKQGKTQEMLDWLEKAQKRAPKDITPRVLLAEYYLREKQPEKADALVVEAIKIAPRQSVLLALQGRVSMAQGHYNDALPTLNKLVTREPDSVFARALLAETYLALGQTKDARRQLDLALEKQPYYVPALLLMARAHLQSGNYDLALESADKAQKAQPELYMGYELAGDAWMGRKNYIKAKGVYTQAWERNQTAELAIKLSEALTQSGQPEKAVDILSDWLNDHTGDTRVRQFLGTTYQNMGQKTRAIQEYEKVLAEQPENIVALNNLAWFYSLTNDPKALELAERAYQANPDDAGIQDTYGWILVQQGQVDKGRRLLEQAMKQLSKVPEVEYHYAIALLKSGDGVQARKLLGALIKDNRPFEGRKDAQAALDTL
ncbi:MAG: PEP-CTERM system TPR-repeat protein PrsT [Gammaproteobacteria bacterium]|nr:PEP-CTERM system TPR-repeat protein PrsT [Gammaproteobacteria bacterium]